jgi:broad specificity phosphatase PhoE
VPPVSVGRIVLVRHGESIANAAAAEAEARGDEVINAGFRDADVPLSATGEEQAAALGRWISENREVVGAATIFSSPYLRAHQTILLALDDAGLDVPVAVDDRLRDRELGILDLLTSTGVAARFPGEDERRRWLGKFYYRPPGGESWVDVALRLRSFLRDTADAAPSTQGSFTTQSTSRTQSTSGGADSAEVLFIATHDAVVMLFIYVCLGMSEVDLLDFASTNTVLNASVTTLVRAPGERDWKLEQFADAAHLIAEGAEVTAHTGEKDVHPE